MMLADAILFSAEAPVPFDSNRLGEHLRYDVDARFGPYATSEKNFAMELLASIADNSLAVVDKGVLAAQILCSLTANGSDRHFLIPAKKILAGVSSKAILTLQ